LDVVGEVDGLSVFGRDPEESDVVEQRLAGIIWMNVHLLNPKFLGVTHVGKV